MEKIDLSNLHPAPGSRKNRKRLGRGIGSGTGKTSGRGHKGRGARSGGNTPPGYEGGHLFPLRGSRGGFDGEGEVGGEFRFPMFACRFGSSSPLLVTDGVETLRIDL